MKTEGQRFKQLKTRNDVTRERIGDKHALLHLTMAASESNTFA